MSPNRRLALDAPAKINLFLHVTGRRSDGYHTLESLVVFTGVGDRLVAGAADEVGLSLTGPFAGPLCSDADDNLVLRAASALLAAAAGHREGVRLLLDKSLPVASGIGGGSADAAATLRLLRRFWNLDIATDELDRIALALGADVPVCLAGRPALMSGVGEKIAPVAALPPCAVVLANGGQPVPTPAVFRARRGAYSDPIGWSAPTDFDALVAALARCRNDLTDAAISVSPVVASVLDALGQVPGCALARLSGSGGTCFGLFRDRDAASVAAAALAAAHPGWWVVESEFRDEAPAVSDA